MPFCALSESKGMDLRMKDKIFNLEQYAQKAREAVAEGIVMLRNENRVLPLASQSKIALFGRSQFSYYKSGTGSGGMVNTRYVTSILDATSRESDFEINQYLMGCYEEWLEEHPYQSGAGWAEEPWFQEEMPLTLDMVKRAREDSDTAILIIGRTAGEDQDNKVEEGSYLLTKIERDMLRKVCEVFDRTVVLLNVGNIIDMKWVDEYRPSAVLYVWQGGQEGGSGVLDVLNGTVSPSGKLTDTIAYDIEDYPSTKYFGDAQRNFYVEDIYVGYRYFETFAQDKVMYPFGFGLSYTEFAMEAVMEGAIGNPAPDTLMPDKGNRIVFTVKVINNGSYPGKEVVQVYVRAPQGVLGKPARSLCGFAKTGTLAPGEWEEVTITCPAYYLASYDDTGATGHRSVYVLEAGEYCFYAGSDVRSAAPAGVMEINELIVVQPLQEAMAPTTPFSRMKAVLSEDGRYHSVLEDVPLRTINPMDRRGSRLPKEIPYTGDRGIRIKDVREGKASAEDLAAQMSDQDLCCLVRGEGMSSPKVTPGTAGAFGGVTESLKAFGLPVACCADGPSGIRMDCGSIAFAMPNGTCLACTFDENLVQELYEWEGLELRKNRVDTLLGPGMNLHRNPLGGRNFEYFSEDPLLTGKIAAAQLRGMHKYGVTGTVKHFACNNQEYARHTVEAVVSERAIREMYLKGFEIAVKEGEAYSIMSTYGPVNGLWTASHYDLLTTILRGEWGYRGIVMTDWWARGNDEGKKGSVKNMSAMVRSQNDLYMVTANAEENTGNDNTGEGLDAGWVTRGELIRSAVNICNYLMRTPAFLRQQGVESELDRQLKECTTSEEEAILGMKDIEITDRADTLAADIDTRKGRSTVFQIRVRERGNYRLTVICRASGKSTSQNENSLAQIPLTVFQDSQVVKMITLSGKDSSWRTETAAISILFNYTCYIKFYFGQGGMEIKECRLELMESLEEEIKIQREKQMEMI